MSSSVRVVPWLTGACSMYAVVRDGVCLPDEFMSVLRQQMPDSAKQLSSVIAELLLDGNIRESYLRPERPELGVFAMYNHKSLTRLEYNPSRLLCSYVGRTNNVLLLGPGFIKSRNEPIQHNADANREAVFLADVIQKLNNRIEHGEISIDESKLVAQYRDSLEF